MINIVIDAWQETPGNVFQKNFRSTFKSLPKFERLVFGAFFIEAFFCLAFAFLRPVYFPGWIKLLYFLVFFSMVVTLVIALVRIYKTKGSTRIRYRHNKLIFLVNLNETFSRYGFIRREQLCECLEYANREIAESRTVRESVVTALSAVLSIFMVAVSIFLSKIVEEASSIAEAGAYVMLICLTVAIIFFFVQILVRNIPMLSFRERRLDCFARDLSFFLMYDLENKSQQTNLQHLLKEKKAVLEQ